MNASHDARAEGSPAFGTPGYTDWVRSVLAEKAASLVEGFPDGAYAQHLGAWRDVFDLLEEGDVIARDGRGLGDPYRGPASPEAPIYLQRVTPSDLWQDRIEVLAYERLMGEALAAGCVTADGVRFLLATDSGGERLREAWGFTDPPVLIGRGTSALGSTARRAMKRPTETRLWGAHLQQLRRREWETAPASVPTLELLWSEADRLREDYEQEFREGPDRALPVAADELYFDFHTGTAVPERHRELVDAIVHDPDFGRDEDDRVVLRHAGQLPEAEQQVVLNGSRDTYRLTLGRALELYAIPWARDLMDRPDVRNMWSDAEFASWVRAQLPDGIEPRLVGCIMSEVWRRRSGRGRAAILLTNDLYARIDPAVLDRVGFTKRRADRHAVLGEVLAELPEEIRQYAGDRIIDRERNERAKTRERRYATAGRVLLDNGFTPAVTARKLGISPSVLERLLATHHTNVKLTTDDPLTAVLPS